MVADCRWEFQGISDLAWSCDSKYIATASDDNTVKIWDAATVLIRKARVCDRHHLVVLAVFRVGASKRSRVIQIMSFASTSIRSQI